MDHLTLTVQNYEVGGRDDLTQPFIYAYSDTEHDIFLYAIVPDGTQSVTANDVVAAAFDYAATFDEDTVDEVDSGYFQDYYKNIPAEILAEHGIARIMRLAFAEPERSDEDMTLHTLFDDLEDKDDA